MIVKVSVFSSITKKGIVSHFPGRPPTRNVALLLNVLSFHLKRPTKSGWMKALVIEMEMDMAVAVFDG
jgi:hypothetical protein